MRVPTLILAGLTLTFAVGTVPALAAPPAKAAAGGSYDAGKLKALEGKLAKSPKDAKLKMQTAEANFQVGHTMMVNPDLPPRVKYPGALKHFNRALSLNPKHAKAAQEKKMIEDIYRQMGRPVPGAG